MATITIVDITGMVDAMVTSIIAVIATARVDTTIRAASTASTGKRR